MLSQQQRLIVGISGASGALYGIRALAFLRQCHVESHLVISQAAVLTVQHELGLTHQALQVLADVVYPENAIGATIASGSFLTSGMLIAPCSIRTMSEIAYGISTSLISRAADVILKERRKLVLMVRETPLHLGHLRNLVSLTEAGAIIMPPVPAFYNHPQNIDDIVNHSVTHALDLLGLDTGTKLRWQGLPHTAEKEKI